MVCNQASYIDVVNVFVIETFLLSPVLASLSS